MKYIRKTFTLDEEAENKLAELQKKDGFNASALVRRSIKRAYEMEMNGYNV
jgi:hypothetical protein